MWRRGAHAAAAAHHLPTAAGAPASASSSSSSGAARRRRRPGLSCRSSHLFFALLVALFTASLLVVWQLLPIGDAVEGDGEAPPRPEDGGGMMMRFLASRAFDGESRLEAARSERRWWAGLAPVRLALVVGSMNIDAQSLMLATLAKSLTNLGYEVEVLAFANGKARDIWENICHVQVVNYASLKVFDWSKYNGVLLSSLEGKRVVSILMQEPFQSLPVVWLIHEDTLGQLVRSHAESHESIPNVIEDWRVHFNACAYVVFPDSYLPLLYSPLDSGNFLVISGSPVDIWAVKRYGSSHSQETMRKQHGIEENDVVILVTDGVNGFIFNSDDPSTVALAMTRILGDKRLLDTAYSVALEGKLLSKNMLAYDCITSHVMLLESVMHYPSDAKLPSSVSKIQERTWLWDPFEMKAALENGSLKDESNSNTRIVDILLGEFHQSNQTIHSDSSDTYDYPSLSDWNDLSEVEMFEDVERREMEEASLFLLAFYKKIVDERVERPLLSWDEVYKNARKSERLKPEGNERDEDSYDVSTVASSSKITVGDFAASLASLPSAMLMTSVLTAHSHELFKKFD
ncbi:hypothetical protein PR202_ga07742 [Eleusine coracana subsp. coracana]|uniref:Uncharacterized protein n=1 Tax=Eleusine coracana subsp. coracana TaxID=191504 RepID=A0AAV5BYB0_ELECO|nr:hypothetical protein PR202_ga07742 [Eleusine coracana subsp. coracana]